MSGQSFFSWFRRERRTVQSEARQQRPRRRPKLEELELRLPPGDLFGLAVGDPFGLLSAPAPAPSAPTASTGSSSNLLSPAPPESSLPSLLSAPAPTSSSPPAAAAPAGPSSSGTGLADLVNFTGISSGFESTSPSPTGGSTSGGGAVTWGGPTGGSSGGTSGGTSMGGMPMVTAITNDAGHSVANAFTNDATPTVSGTAGANQSLQLLLNGEVHATVTAGADGKWSHTVGTSLSDGVKTFSARATGSMFSGYGLQTTIDTTAPSVSLTVNDFVARGDQAWVSITTNDASGVAQDYRVDVDLNDNGSYADTGEMNYGVSPSPSFNLSGLPEGTFKMRARVTDRAGNEGTSNSATMQVDPNAGYIGSQILNNLALAYGYGQPGDPATDDRFGLLRFDEQNRVMVEVRATLPRYLASVTQELQNMGMQVLVVTPSANMVTGYLPIRALHALDPMAHFAAVAPVPMPRTLSGSVQTEGDAVMKADAFRNDFGVDGSGINVGIMSDSIDQVGGGISTSQSTGDLPGTVNVLLDFTGSGASDEGRAMAEIVYDVAPGSGLFFRTAFIDAPDFAQGIRDLADAGCLVITDDVAYLNAPLFSSGRMGQAIEEVTGRGVVFTSAAGNIADQGWRSGWQSTDATIDSVTGTFFDFGGGDVFQEFNLADDDSITLQFAWDEFYLEGGDPSFQVNIDMAVHIINRDDDTIAMTFDADNPNIDEASELFTWVNDQDTDNLALAFQLKSGGTPSRVGWVEFDGLMSNVQDGGGPTVVGHRLEVGAIACAAAPASDPSSPEDFSSRGGDLEVFFANDGTRFASPQLRQKPDITGPDGTNTTLSSFAPFFGTSAAAPHVAAAAALILEQSGGADPLVVQQHFKDTALDMLAPGFDRDTGFGLLQLAPLTLPVPDRFEINDTSDASTNLGAISGSITIGDLSIVPTLLGLPDYDWFQFQAGTGGTASVAIDGRGLELYLFTFSSGFLTPVGTSTVVAAGDTLFVEVKGRDTGSGSTTGKYDLTISVV